MSEARVTDSPDTEVIEPAQTEVTEAVAPVESNTPGSVLRRTREARGQSISDVVQVIRFSARQIEALERDDYASLPGSTAVRGLVRNYAKFLKLDASPLLAQLEPAVPVPESDVRPPTNMGEAEQPGIVERVPLKLMVAAVVVLLLTLVGYWYNSGVSGDASLTSRLPGVAGKSEVVAPSPVVAPAVVPVSAPAVVAENEPGNAGAAVSPSPSGGLHVEFDDRSWIEIRDATQKVVFVGEYPAGTRQNVEGKAPFQVWIGRASAVRVFMGERSIDLKPYTREEVARFNLE
ncbi:MAG: helix-turn-helix domain-containing protein [Rhodocyclales bacterium]|nr:helix-turn-helix domain-containing protein [Rhodocyclales bacterium]